MEKKRITILIRSKINILINICIQCLHVNPVFGIISIHWMVYKGEVLEKRKIIIRRLTLGIIAGIVHYFFMCYIPGYSEVVFQLLYNELDTNYNIQQASIWDAMKGPLRALFSSYELPQPKCKNLTVAEQMQNGVKPRVSPVSKVGYEELKQHLRGTPHIEELKNIIDINRDMRSVIGNTSWSERK